MNQKEFTVQFFAGLFFIIGIILIFIVVFFIGLDKGLMQPRFDVTVAFRDVGGLSVGAPIRLSGVMVGSVRQIDFLDKEIQGRHVVVTCSFFRRYREQINKAHTYRISTEGLLGQKIIEISMDSTGQGQIHKEGKMILGQDPLDVQDLARTMEDTVLSFQDAAQALSRLAVDAQNKFQSIKRMLNRAEQRLIDGTLFRMF